MSAPDAAAPRLPDNEPRPPAMSHGAIFLRFLRFGCLAFGGPVAQIAMIRRELVEDARWLSPARFNRLLAVLQALPGPEAHELCVHLGIRAGGRLGGLLAGLGFMLPGFCLMLGLAFLYTRLPLGGWLGAVFLGVQAAVLGLILRALQTIGRHILVDRWLWAVAAGAALATLAGVGFLLVLGAAGLAYQAVAARRLGLALLVLLMAAMLALLLARLAPALALLPLPMGVEPSTLALFGAGLKGGLLTFGGAYTAIPFVRADTVGRGWMGDPQFLDGLGLASLFPAPLVIFVTFVGFVVGGLPGALAITAGMFLLAFAFSLLFYERLDALADHGGLRHFLAGVAAAVVGLMAVTFFDLARMGAAASPRLPASLMIAALAFLLLLVVRHRLAPLGAILLGASAGLLLMR